MMPRDSTNQVPALVTTRDEIRQAVCRERAAGKSIGLVPTMGALHAGHLSLVEASVAECDFTVVTIFVNPTQFGAGEDFEEYPRAMEADLAALAPYHVDLVFAPPVEEMYPSGNTTSVDAGAVARPLEGQFRPGHFPGVATIVMKLFQAVPAVRAYFGQKDYQQSLVVRRMAIDLDARVEIRVCPTVREPDGLAMSSRNAYLSPAERERASCLWKSLQAARQLVRDGERNSRTILSEMRRVIDMAGDVRIDYVALVDPETMQPIEHLTGHSLAAIAVRIGETRLIDNELLEP